LGVNEGLWIDLDPIDTTYVNVFGPNTWKCEEVFDTLGGFYTIECVINVTSGEIQMVLFVDLERREGRRRWQSGFGWRLKMTIDNAGVQNQPQLAILLGHEETTYI